MLAASEEAESMEDMVDKAKEMGAEQLQKVNRVLNNLDPAMPHEVMQIDTYSLGRGNGEQLVGIDSGDLEARTMVTPGTQQYFDVEWTIVKCENIMCIKE